MKVNQLMILALALILSGCGKQNEVTRVYLIGDSTMANYADNYDPGKNYYQTRYPVTGWGQVFQEFFTGADMNAFSGLISTDSVRVDNRARGGRSTRTFFQEGRWRSVFDELEPGDLVLMQFGHNDAARQKPERYVDIEGYQEFLRLYVNQTRQKEAIPIILTPVCRNYPWVDGHLENVHGDYPGAARAVARELNTLFIDLNQLSMDAFSAKDKEYVTQNYFMNLDSGAYEAYPSGLNDNTHFQPEGAKAVAGLVYEALKELELPTD